MKRMTRFFKTESAAGLTMLGVAALAMLIANSPLAALYHDNVAPLSHWINDVLMVFFFLHVGMELKSEMTGGALADKKNILLPLIAAIGGMAAPAAVYLFINRDIAAHWNGWAIASATDIAFAICVLQLVGKSVPNALKIFLLAIAIFDDLGAILIIAFFYSHGVALLPLLASIGITGALYAFNRLRILRLWPYMLAGIALWFTLHASGIHTTLAGVIVGLFIPRERLKGLMHTLHPWVAFLVLPIFAFASAGVPLGSAHLLAPLPLSIALGLFIGKQLGIFGASYALIRLGFAKLPAAASWRQVYGAATVAGIGFTMSLFIGMLAFKDPALQEQVKIGVIAGSLLSALLGAILLRR